MSDRNYEQEARDMGWKPKEEYRGDDSKWVDAETFVKRGENYIPILRAENGRLKEQLAATTAKVTELESAVVEAKQAMQDFREFQTEHTKAAVQRARAELIAQLKAARESGDVDAEVEAQASITKIDAQLAAAPKPEKAPAPPAPAPATDPAYEAWLRDNPWFSTNARKRGLAMGIAEELRADPANKDLKGRAFYDKITEEVEAALAERRESKVDGGRPSGAPAPAAGGKRERTYADLPAEAKAACDRQGEKLVGKGKAFTDQAAWRAHYTKVYFAGEEA